MRLLKVSHSRDPGTRVSFPLVIGNSFYPSFLCCIQGAGASPRGAKVKVRLHSGQVTDESNIHLHSHSCAILPSEEVPATLKFVSLQHG